MSLQTSELIEELEAREYTVTKGNFSFEKEHVQFLLEKVDQMPQDWFVRQIRDSLVTMLENR